jgi:hypothetical protein
VLGRSVAPVGVASDLVAVEQALQGHQWWSSHAAIRDLLGCI